MTNTTPPLVRALLDRRRAYQQEYRARIDAIDLLLRDHGVDTGDTVARAQPDPPASRRRRRRPARPPRVGSWGAARKAALECLDGCSAPATAKEIIAATGVDCSEEAMRLALRKLEKEGATHRMPGGATNQPSQWMKNGDGSAAPDA